MAEKEDLENAIAEAQTEAAAIEAKIKGLEAEVQEDEPPAPAPPAWSPPEGVLNEEESTIFKKAT